MRKTIKILNKIILVFIVVIFLGVSVFFTAFATFNDHTVVVTITDKERVTKYNKENTSSYYLVFAEDSQGNGVVYQNVDAPIRGKWDSSTMQANLKIGETYELTLVGYRIPFVSSYENIIDYKRVQ